MSQNYRDDNDPRDGRPPRPRHSQSARFGHHHTAEAPFFDPNWHWQGFQPPPPPNMPFSMPMPHAPFPYGMGGNQHFGHAYGFRPQAQSFVHQPAYLPTHPHHMYPGHINHLPASHYHTGTATTAGERGYTGERSLGRSEEPTSDKLGNQGAAPKKGSRKIHRPAPPPSEEYKETVLQKSIVIDPPNPFLIVLDLNGTLIHRPSRNRPTYMIARPFLKPFLQYLFENFHVMVWSSAMPTNVNKIVKNVLDEELQSRLVAAWARDTFGLPTGDYHQNVQVYKDLRLIWDKEEIQKHHPGHQAGQRFGQHNTILLDDSKLKAHAQPHNLIEIPEFTATKEQMGSDILREVAGYLQTARMQSNVSNFMLEHPFEADGRWQYDWPDDLAQAGEMHDPAHLRDGLTTAPQRTEGHPAAGRDQAYEENSTTAQDKDEPEEDVPMDVSDGSS
ncbi:HAD-like protein [Westerdykella ornata]|uniref:Mitochondrial import inner membrane translocase subunit TIM50 n=1 Tax=Westerdykella ornata TaxID=318751 RepID=A0A6A6JWC3_WESOR|nr:HAD-like protein [Westerdykella ornata]KAF2280383.1 HAD-like protein [Westerdykella ornata]